MDSFVAGDEMRGPLVCPKPRRIGQLTTATDLILPLRWQSCYPSDPLDLRSGVELLDIFATQEDSTPPLFCGSPPTRSTNPLVNDARFIELESVNEPVPSLIPAPATATARTGCARTKFGFTPAAIRIEGFDCLDRGRSRSRGISAVA